MARTTSSFRSSFRSSAAWKAAAAAGVGVVLLGAGGATFAQWSETQASAVDTPITSGVLNLEGGQGSWTNVAGADVTAAVTGGSYQIVPGDALTYRETMTIDAQGDLLTATVSHNLRDLTGNAELLDQLEARTSMSLNGQVVEGDSTSVVAEDEKQVLDVAVTVAFDQTTEGLVGQGKSVALGGLDVTLTQTPVTAD